ncbi:adenylate/guanylate cyclase domain-containing protein [Methyloceanibacter sp. wino2]|uniref:adenylate/guanylate cyclase domain-containing protein n=1 Tax=Methyloceanibacter sp. wino2 TaxID=2170729 RepID=UPI00131EE3D3|nr:adenylate/guanylate cyclase domain-containing protein [Methyloceanibacter sp. wino2]
MEPVPTSPRIERKLVGILAADVVRFSSHMEHDEERTLQLLTERRKLIDELIEAHAGRITGTAGDSVVAEFASAVNAVDCAVKIQREIMRVNAKEAEHDGLSFRIGVNVGDVMVKDADIFGDGVNVAARLESLSEPDGVCLSRGVHEYVRKLTNYVYADLGEQYVKNIEQPVRAYRIVFEDGEPVLSEEDTPSQEALDVETHEPPEYELAFWESIRDGDVVAEFEAYLDKYPEGAFAALAAERLKVLSEKEGEPELPEADPVELAYWESIKDSENAEMFQTYLETYAEGAFAAIARLKVAELR